MLHMFNPCELSYLKTASEESLEEFMLFCILVAGKNADRTAKVVNDILKDIEKPFEYLSNCDLGSLLRSYKTGQYSRIEKAIKGVLGLTYHKNLSLRNLSFEQLVTIKGIGSKTASFFLVYTSGEKRAIIDTHIASFLRDIGLSDIPKNKISSNYKKLELLFLDVCDTLGMSPEELDLELWKLYSGKNNINAERLFKVYEKYKFKKSSVSAAL